MKVGMSILCSNYHGIPDADMFRNEIKLAVEAEAMGFDWVSPVEHHFSDYAMIPDNTVFLAHVGAQTKRIQLMVGAFILPWNDPLRVVEKAIMLDILSDGRVFVGMARGLARSEFRGFRVDMVNSREMFDEAAEIVIRGLETGIVEGEGKWFKQPRVEVRPRPERSFKGRMCMVGMSPSSVEVAARLGLTTLKFSNASWDEAVREVNQYRELFKQYHQIEAPPFIVSDLVICFEDPRKNTDYADKYFKRYSLSVNEHYELSGDHFKDLPSYKKYADQGAQAKAVGYDKAYLDYVNANLIGTPDEIVERHLARRELLGEYDLAVNFSFGGMPYKDVWDQAKRFAEKVLPRLKG